ncbi:MAG: hypothetical protein P8J37_24420 [Fuerstiella sp.]|nr:hypothetical protein [Fuerstiella sp.]
MANAENSSVPTDSYLLEHSHGTCELWVKRSTAKDFTSCEPVQLRPISGQETILLCSAMIAEAMLLQEWMDDHLEVFKEGRTSYD